MLDLEKATRICINGQYETTNCDKCEQLAECKIANEEKKKDLHIINVNEAVYGKRTWGDFHVEDLLKERKKNRIIAMSFPEHSLSLGLEPSILTVLPQDKECEFSQRNIRFNDDDVKLYLCSVYISGMEEFTEWARHHDKAKIVVGGYHPTTFPEEFVSLAHKIIIGPCDDFWATMEQEGQIVKGITTHKNIPRYDLWNLEWNQQIIPDKFPKDICTSINTSMGCPMKCDFCCSPIMCDRIVSKPIDLIEREINYLMNLQINIPSWNSPKPRFIFIRDENFPLQSDYKERLEIISRLGAKIYLFVSANLINEEMIKAFVDNRVYMCCLGLEDITVEYSKNKALQRACDLLHEAGIYVYLSFIVNPLKIVGRDSGKEFYDRLTQRFEDLKPEMVCGNFLMPFRGTKLWDEYYHLVSKEDFKSYDSKSAFLVKNEIVRAKQEFFMFYYQWKYYTSDFYNENIRKFGIHDTLHTRFQELYNEFYPKYLSIFNQRP